MRTALTKAVVMAFLGVLILLGILHERNCRKAWSASKAQVMIRLTDRMTCQKFELIGCFIHAVSVIAENAMATVPFRKICPLQDYNYKEKNVMRFTSPCNIYPLMSAW